MGNAQRSHEGLRGPWITQDVGPVRADSGIVRFGPNHGKARPEAEAPPAAPRAPVVHTFPGAAGPAAVRVVSGAVQRGDQLCYPNDILMGLSILEAKHLVDSGTCVPYTGGDG